MENEDNVNILENVDATDEQIQQRFEEIKAEQAQLNKEANVTEKKEETPAKTEEKSEKSIWDEDDILNVVKTTTTEQKVKKEEIVEDFKAKYEEVTGKIVNNKLLKTLFDVVNSPEFDYEKFIESQIIRKVDYASQTLENLYKANLEADKIANYTEDEIEQLWEEKKVDLDGNTAKEKSLKSELVNKFKNNEQRVSQDEPETIKVWKQSQQQKQIEADKEKLKWNTLDKEIKDYSKTLIGKKIGGVVITEEDANGIIPNLTLSQFSEKAENGETKLNAKKIGEVTLKGLMFDKVVEYLKKEAIIEATKKVTRPNSQGGGNSAVDTDGRTENEKMLDAYAQSKGLKSHKDLQ